MSGAPLSSETTPAQFLPPPDPSKKTRGTSGGRGGSNLRGYILHLVKTQLVRLSHTQREILIHRSTQAVAHTHWVQRLNKLQYTDSNMAASWSHETWLHLTSGKGQ